MMANTFMRNWQDTEPTTERSYTTGPSFASKDANITAIEGTDVQLVCKVFNLANKTVKNLIPAKVSVFSQKKFCHSRILALYTVSKNGSHAKKKSFLSFQP